MESADRYGADFLRLLCSADRFKEAAIFLGSLSLNTPPSRSSASLSRVTRADHRPALLRRADLCGADLRRDDSLTIPNLSLTARSPGKRAIALSRPHGGRYLACLPQVAH